MKPVRQTPSATLLALALAALALLGACSKSPDVVVANPPSAAPATWPASAATSPSAMANVADIDVTEQVKTALLRSDMLQGMDITVVTTKGDVRLTGVLDNQAQVDEALRLARAIEGSHTIHHELTVRN